MMKTKLKNQIYKNQICNNVYEKLDLNKTEIEKTYNLIFETIASEIKKGNKIVIKNFGCLYKIDYEVSEKNAFIKNGYKKRSKIIFKKSRKLR